MIVRKALPTDAARIAAIYNYYIRNTVVTFEENEVSESTMAARIHSISGNYPYLVVLKDNELIGFAYATAWKERSAYRYSVETTIYLGHKQTGGGAGSILYAALLDALKKTSAHSIVGGIALPNEASIRLHEKFGFKKIAQFEQIGCKFEQWIDVGYWEKIL